MGGGEDEGEVQLAGLGGSGGLEAAADGHFELESFAAVEASSDFHLVQLHLPPSLNLVVLVGSVGDEVPPVDGPAGGRLEAIGLVFSGEAGQSCHLLRVINDGNWNSGDFD